MSELKIKSHKRNSAVAKLRGWCPQSHDRDQDFLQMTEWSCEGGFDIEVQDKSGTRTFSFTWGQFDAFYYVCSTNRNYTR
jgi:hypothetical protein